MSELMLRVQDVSKQYRLGQIGGTTLRDELQRFSAKLHHREDPTRVIGARKYTSGEVFMALKGVSFDVMKGERVGIIGHNGAGKSTLLKLISRVTAPTGGRIGLNGRVASMLEVGTGFHGELTGRENIYMNGAILGMKKREIDAKIEDIIDFSECRQFIDTPVKRYSSGMYVKLAFSVAAHLDAEIMIMDEVLAVGDMAFQRKCLDKMSQVSKDEGRTILYVSHNMNTIRQLCDRCVVLDHGMLMFDGEVDSAIGQYLNMSSDNQSTYINLDSMKRPENSTNAVRMYSLELLNAPNCVIHRGDKMQFKLVWKGKRLLHDIKYRMIVRYIDDTPVGLVQSPPLGNTEPDQIWETVFDFDTSLLSDGRYYFSIALYQNDQAGNSTILDHVTRAFSVEVLSGTNDNRNLTWSHRWWGHVAFPSIEIKTNSRCEAVCKGKQ